MKKGYKWINRRIEQLDPHVDYAEIWRLSSCYGLTDFIQNFSYCFTFPNFVVTEWGARAVWREDGGKLLYRATHRAEQTGINNTTWWYYGPQDDRTIKSVENINKLHAHYAKQYPGDFSDHED